MFAVPLTVTVAVVLPVMLLIVAEIVVVPPPCPVARPPDEIVATGVFDELQVTLDVTFAVVLLLYVAVAVNCCVAPLAKLGSEGVTVMAVSVRRNNSQCCAARLPAQRGRNRRAPRRICRCQASRIDRSHRRVGGGPCR